MDARNAAYYAKAWGVSESKARAILKEKVACGEMRRSECVEMRYSRTHGYSGKLRPVRVVEYI